MHRPARRRLLPPTLGLAIAVTALVAAAPAQAAGVGTITGVVRDGSATVGAGLVVTARTPADEVLATATTDATGAYTLSNVPAGFRVVCFDGTGTTGTSAAAGYLFVCNGGLTAAQASPVRVGVGKTTAVDATVAAATVVAGRVTDPQGAPLAGVAVDVDSDYQTDRVTGADGTYRYAFDARYESSVQPCFVGSAATGGVSTVGYQRACWKVPGGRYDLPVAVGRIYTVNQKLQPSSTITGRVTDTQGRPLVGILVVADADDYADHRTTTDTDGRYTIGSLPSRSPVYVSFIPDVGTTGPSPLGYLGQCWKDIPRGYGCNAYTDGITAVTTPTGKVRSGISAKLVTAGGISGRVIDAAGRAIPNLTLYVGSAYARTAADGSYRVVGLDPTDRHDVCFSDSSSYVDSQWPDQEGYDRHCFGGDDVFGADVPVTSGAMTTGIDLTLVGRGAITGTTLDASGQPLAGVHVSFESHDGFRYVYDQTTAADGTFRSGRMSVGTYSVCYDTDPYEQPQVPALGYVRQCHDVTVTDNATTAADPVTMVVAGAITGRVTDAYGFALDGVTVRVADAASGDDVTAASMYDGSGTYDIGGLAPGRYTVCFDTTYARRASDDFRPARGYASQCWQQRATGRPPTVVEVTSGNSTGGISAVVRPNPA